MHFPKSRSGVPQPNRKAFNYVPLKAVIGAGVGRVFLGLRILHCCTKRVEAATATSRFFRLSFPYYGAVRNFSQCKWKLDQISEEIATNDEIKTRLGIGDLAPGYIERILRGQGIGKRGRPPKTVK